MSRPELGSGGYVRALRTGLRTVHLLAFGALYGGHVYGVAPERLLPALLGTLGSGGARWVVGAPIALVQLRGLATCVSGPAV